MKNLVLFIQVKSKYKDVEPSIFNILMRCNIEYIPIAEKAKEWGISERSVRNYATNGRIEDAKLNEEVNSTNS